MDLIRLDLTAEYDPVDPRWESQRAAQLRRHPTPEFRVCVCLYILAHGGRVKPVADGVGLGESTVHGWLEPFFQAVIARVRPVYMSGEPPSPGLVQRIRSAFGSRRGIGEVCMAVNGPRSLGVPSVGLRAYLAARHPCSPAKPNLLPPPSPGA